MCRGAGVSISIVRSSDLRGLEEGEAKNKIKL
jgi:hypothetical protein